MLSNDGDKMNDRNAFIYFFEIMAIRKLYYNSKVFL